MRTFFNHPLTSFSIDRSVCSVPLLCKEGDLRGRSKKEKNGKAISLPKDAGLQYTILHCIRYPSILEKFEYLQAKLTQSYNLIGFIAFIRFLLPLRRDRNDSLK
jgi:hypothetical protein